MIIGHGVHIFLVLLCLGNADDASQEHTEREPNLVREMVHDFGNVFTTRENLVTLGVGAGTTAVLHPWDDDVATGAFNSETSGNTSLDGVFEPGEVLGGAAVQIGSAFATYSLGKLANRPHLERLGRDLVRAQVVTQTLTFALKTAVGRERPDGSNARSFPSGHASGIFATATVLQRHYGWRVGVPAYAVASYVAVSRLNEGRHYLSDVAFGATIGILVGRTVTIDVGGQIFAIEPLLTARTVGLQVRWVPDH